MKTRLGLLVTDSGVCESEPKELIEVGKTYELIRHEKEHLFKGETDIAFQHGDLGFRANSRKDHLDRLAVEEFNSQYGFSLAGQIMQAFCNGDGETDGASLLFEFKQYTDEEWEENERRCEELGY